MFESLKEVTRGNSKKATTGSKRPSFQIKVQEEKSTILFSANQFAEMTLADNSLSQFVEEGGNRVFLAVMPGNSGSFAKTTARGLKGKKFKNEKLVNNLKENDYDLDNVGLEKVGEEDGKVLYQVTGNGAALFATPEQPAEQEATSTPVEERPEVAAFEADTARPDGVEIDHEANVAEDEAIEDALTSSEEELEF